MLQKGDLDIAVADLTVTHLRSTVVDFLPTLKETYHHIFLKNPVDSLHWSGYVEPLTPLCWLGILLFVVISPPVVAGIMLYGQFC